MRMNRVVDSALNKNKLAFKVIWTCFFNNFFFRLLNLHPHFKYFCYRNQKNPSWLYLIVLKIIQHDDFKWNNIFVSVVRMQLQHWCLSPWQRAVMQGALGNAVKTAFRFYIRHVFYYCYCVISLHHHLCFLWIVSASAIGHTNMLQHTNALQLSLHVKLRLEKWSIEKKAFEWGNLHEFPFISSSSMQCFPGTCAVNKRIKFHFRASAKSRVFLSLLWYGCTEALGVSHGMGGMANDASGGSYPCASWLIAVFVHGPL